MEMLPTGHSHRIATAMPEPIIIVPAVRFMSFTRWAL
jgi:hypothetical protein